MESGTEQTDLENCENGENNRSNEAMDVDAADAGDDAGTASLSGTTPVLGHDTEHNRNIFSTLATAFTSLPPDILLQDEQLHDINQSHVEVDKKQNKTETEVIDDLTEPDPGTDEQQVQDICIDISGENSVQSYPETELNLEKSPEVELTSEKSLKDPEIESTNKKSAQNLETSEMRGNTENIPLGETAPDKSESTNGQDPITGHQQSDSIGSVSNVKPVISSDTLLSSDLLQLDVKTEMTDEEEFSTKAKLILGEATLIDLGTVSASEEMQDFKADITDSFPLSTDDESLIGLSSCVQLDSNQAGKHKERMQRNQKKHKEIQKAMRSLKKKDKDDIKIKYQTSTSNSEKAICTKVCAGKLCKLSHQCKECHKTFSRGDTLKYHMQTHLKGSYKCTICKKHSISNLKTHVCPQHKCPECPKTFPRHDTLKRHMVTNCTNHKIKIKAMKNLKMKPLKYLMKTHLKTHSKIHLSNSEKAKKKKDNEDINKKDQTSTSNNEKGICTKVCIRKLCKLSHQCKECHKTFSRGDTLKLHMQTHLKDFTPKYKCPKCPKTCPRPSTLKKHMETHPKSHKIKAPRGTQPSKDENESTYTVLKPTSEIKDIKERMPKREIEKQSVESNSGSEDSPKKRGRPPSKGPFKNKTTAGILKSTARHSTKDTNGSGRHKYTGPAGRLMKKAVRRSPMTSADQSSITEILQQLPESRSPSDHKMSRKSKNLLTCPVCKQFFWLKLTLQQHMERHKKPKHVTESPKPVVQKHQQIIKSSKPVVHKREAIIESPKSAVPKMGPRGNNFECNMCSLSFPSLRAVTHHLLIHGKDLNSYKFTVSFLE